MSSRPVSGTFLNRSNSTRKGSAGRRRCKYDIAIFPLNGIVFALYPRDKLTEDVTVSAKGSGFAGITIAYLGRNEREVDAVLEQGEKTGG